MKKLNFYYLTIEELNKLSQYDLTGRQDLAAIRDLFILQCITGIRKPDLLALTSANVIGETLQYVERKTNKVIHVQLTSSAKQIVERDRCNDQSALFPPLLVAKYNQSIKEALRLAGINRVVAVMNPKTGIEESHPIYEVASSTLARRSFLANLSMNITPELISKLTGHAESNSKTKNI